MTGRMDRLAWLAAALAIVIWAFLPRMLWADEDPLAMPSIDGACLGCEETKETAGGRCPVVPLLPP